MGDWKWQIVEWPSSLWHILQALEEDSSETTEVVTITRRGRRKRVTAPKTRTKYSGRVRITKGEIDLLTDFYRKTTTFKAIRFPHPRGFNCYLRFSTDGFIHQEHPAPEEMPKTYTLILTLIDITEHVEGGVAPTWTYKNSAD